MKCNQGSTNTHAISRSRLVPSPLPAQTRRRRTEKEKAQKKKDGNLYSTRPPAWTAVKSHAAALQGREEGSTESKKKEEAGGWEEKIVSDD